MKKLMMVVGMLTVAGMISGCQMWKEMQERQAHEEAARKAEMAEKGPVRYFLEKKGTAEQIAKAKAGKPFDPDWAEARRYCVASYEEAVKSLEKVAVVQDGIAVWERALNAQSEKVQKERKDFTPADEQAAYDAVVAAAAATDAAEQAKKELVALNTYLVWGKTLEAEASAAARKRNAAFLQAVVKYTAQGKKIAEKLKKDKLKMAAAIAEALQDVGYLSLAGEAAELEAQVMEAGKNAAGHLKGVEAK